MSAGLGWLGALKSQQQHRALRRCLHHSITVSCLCAGFPDTKAEGLEGQINRLAKLIGKLEDKVRASTSLRRAVLPSQRQFSPSCFWGGRRTCSWEC